MPRYVRGSGATLDGLTSDSTGLYPTTTDTRALGTSTKMWSDLFLASGGVINFDAGDVTLAHAADLLTLAGGNLALPSSTTAIRFNANGFPRIGNSGTNFYVEVGTGANGFAVMNASGAAVRNDYQFVFSSTSSATGTPDAGFKRTGAGAVQVTNGTTGYGSIAIGNTVNAVSPTSPDRTVTIDIGGTTYYLHAKTTND